MLDAVRDGCASDRPYVPVNMPAVGDLFDMFDFGHDDRDDR
jgi:phospholipase C